MNILVTGGASGLGEAITTKLASVKEDIVFFTFNKSSEKAGEIEHRFSNCEGIKCDFQNPDDLNSLIAFIEKADLDILVNNAFLSGITQKHFHKTDFLIFQDNFNINIIPVIRITQSVITQFRRKKYGKIITVLSSALAGNPPLGWSEYVAGKAYLASLCKSWAVENNTFNITSNSVSPSFMQTNLTLGTDDRIIDEFIDAHPLKQLLSTHEVSDAVYFLTKCSQQINGINLIMNAGTHVI
jgi:3-oxoacyl-[acyl-carrier protein] reductase